MHFQKRNRLFSRASLQLGEKRPFVLFRRPNETLVTGVFQDDAKLHQLTDYSQKGFVFIPFSEGSTHVLIPPHTVISDMAPLPPKTLGQLRVDTENGKDIHIQSIVKAIESIKTGQLKKVVISRCFEVKTDSNPIQLFLALLNTYATAFCYLFFHPEIGLWLGATPEQFLSIKNNGLATEALAGTLPYVSGRPPNWTKKELDEQAMVAEHILSGLLGLGLQPTSSGATSKKAGGLWHLATRISAELTNLDQISAIVGTLHPTPAVCGLPVSTANDFILEHEGYDREYYTGFLGELNLNGSSHTNLFVNLRCMQLTITTAKIYVGGGITKDSVPEAEWQETVNKSRTMLDLL